MGVAGLMATTPLNFSAQIDAWTAAVKERAEAVFRESTKRTISIAQSYTPVDTGYLRASIRASTTSMPPINPAGRPTGTSYPYNAGEVVLVITGAQLGQTIYAGWTANYAIYVEMGTSRTPPRGFVARAAQQWQATVNAVTSEAKSRASGR